jgi:hypothetical protein
VLSQRNWETPAPVDRTVAIWRIVRFKAWYPATVVISSAVPGWPRTAAVM